MVPSVFVPLTRMPLNANAKIDRRALPDPDPTRPNLERPYVAPRDDLESDLASIWEEVLGVQPVGVRDSFYDLGGDSLLVARLFAQIDARFAGALEGDAARGPVSIGHVFSVSHRRAARAHLSPAKRFVLRPRDRTESGRRAGSQAPRAGQGAPARPRAVQRPAFGRAQESPLAGACALCAGARSIRVRLHRMRGVRIGKDVFIGLGVLLESGHPRMVSIGNHVTISVRSVIIAHFAGSARWARLGDDASVRIEDNVYIGPGVFILPNVTIGQGAVVAAGSVVTQSVPPLTMVQGNPAARVAQCGVPLVGNTYEHFVRNLKFVDG